MGTVKYLLDTHTLLWAIQKDVELSDAVKEIITDKDLQANLNGHIVTHSIDS